MAHEKVTTVAQAIAICDSCGCVIAAAATEKASNARSEFEPRATLACPLPGCSGSGTSLRAAHGAAAGALATLCKVPVSRPLWAGLADILKRARAEGLAGNEIAAEIERQLPAAMHSVATEFRRMSSKAAAVALRDGLSAAISGSAVPRNTTTGESQRQSAPERPAFLTPAPHDHDHDHAGHNCADHSHAHSRPHTNPHKKIGRNEPCWCGSGQKYKRCHGAHPQ
jgi:hypothetical protein